MPCHATRTVYASAQYVRLDLQSSEGSPSREGQMKSGRRLLAWGRDRTGGCSSRVSQHTGGKRSRRVCSATSRARWTTTFPAIVVLPGFMGLSGHSASAAGRSRRCDPAPRRRAAGSPILPQGDALARQYDGLWFFAGENLNSRQGESERPATRSARQAILSVTSAMQFIAATTWWGSRHAFRTVRRPSPFEGASWSSNRVNPGAAPAALLSQSGQRHLGTERRRRCPGAIFIWCAPIGRSSHAQQCDQRVSSSVDAAVRGAGSTTTDRRRRVTISAFYRAEHFVKNIVSALCKMKNDAIAITPATGRFCN